MKVTAEKQKALEIAMTTVAEKRAALEMAKNGGRNV